MTRKLSAAVGAGFAAVLVAGLAGAACNTKSEPAGNAATANANAPARPASNANAAANANASAPAAGAELAKAQDLFKTNCQSCHLATGKGDPKHKKNDIPDFTNAAWQARQKDEELFKSIKNGHGKMPPFKEDLSDDEIRQVLGYVRGFPTRGADAAPAAATK